MKKLLLTLFIVLAISGAIYEAHHALLALATFLTTACGIFAICLGRAASDTPETMIETEYERQLSARLSGDYR